MSDRWFDGTFYKREITINYMDCNTEKKLSLHHILALFSEIAGDEFQAKGHTHEYFINLGMLFLITRMSIRFHRTPLCNETLILTTWFRKTEGRFYLRDCDIKSPEGELIASASGTWALINPIEHKAIEPSENSYKHSSFYDVATDSPECKKIVTEAQLPVIGTRPVYYSDLDCNYHVNNGVYSRIALDFLPQEYQRLEVMDYVVNFTRETSLGETLEIRGGETENGYIIQGFCDNAQHFASEFVFRK